MSVGEVDETVDGRPWEYRPGRVRRAVDDDRPGARRDPSLELVEVRKVAAAFGERVRDRGRRRELGVRRVQNESRVRYQHLVARVVESERDRDQTLRAAPGDDHVLAAGRGRSVPVPLGDLLPELGETGGRPVVVPPVTHRAAKGLDRRRWRVEIRLAETQVDRVRRGAFEHPSDARYLDPPGPLGDHSALDGDGPLYRCAVRQLVPGAGLLDRRGQWPCIRRAPRRGGRRR